MKKLYLLSSTLVILACLNVSSQDLVYFDQGGATPHMYIQAGGQVYVEGGVVANATVNATSGLDGAGELYLVDGTTSTTSNWTDNTAGGLAVNNASTGTVYMQSGFTQTMTGSSTFHNLIANNSSGTGINLAANANFKVKGALTLNDGLVHGISNSHMIITNSATASLIQGGSNAGWANSYMEVNYANGSSFDREIVNSASIYNFPVGNTSRVQLLQVTPTNITGISRFASSWQNGVVGNTPIALWECPAAGQPYQQVHSYGEWHLRPANGGTYGTGGFAGGAISMNGYFNIGSGGFGGGAGLIDNYFALLYRNNGDGTSGGWQKPSAPGPLFACGTLPAVGAPGRIVSSDFAARYGVDAFDDTYSQIGVGITYWPLPIELLSFTGWNEGDVNQLTWTTSTEINSDYFDVQRSPDGSNTYTGIGQVDAAGFSYVPLTYYFTDYEPYHGLNYYRLKMVDLDLSYAYSNIVIIELNDEAVQTVSIYPNPTLSDINLQIHAVDEQEVLIELTDVLGRTLQSQVRHVLPGNNIFNIDLKDLSSSSYFISVKSLKDAEVQTFKLIKTN